MKGKGHVSLSEEEKHTAFLNYSKDKLTEKVKNFYLFQFEEQISSLLLQTEKDFFETLNKMIKLILEDTFSVKSSDSISLSEICKDTEKWLKNDIYSLTKKILNDSCAFFLEKRLKQVNSSPLMKGKSIETFPYLTLFRKHCIMTDSLAVHDCGEKVLQITNSTGQVTHILCLSCKKVYLPECVNLMCEFCQSPYYSCFLNNEEEVNIQPATWEKYHCGAMINDKMHCIKCKSIFHIDLKSKKLKCLSCNFSADPMSIEWLCMICKETFSSEAKVYNPLEFKKIKDAIRKTLLQKVNAAPKSVPCCTVDTKANTFIHKKECDGKLFSGTINNKEIVVCDKCKTMNFYDKYIWTCPKCFKRFKQKTDDEKVGKCEPVHKSPQSEKRHSTPCQQQKDGVKDYGNFLALSPNSPRKSSNLVTSPSLQQFESPKRVSKVIQSSANVNYSSNSPESPHRINYGSNSPDRPDGRNSSQSPQRLSISAKVNETSSIFKRLNSQLNFIQPKNTSNSKNANTSEIFESKPSNFIIEVTPSFDMEEGREDRNQFIRKSVGQVNETNYRPVINDGQAKPLINLLSMSPEVKRRNKVIQSEAPIRMGSIHNNSNLNNSNSKIFRNDSKDPISPLKPLLRGSHLKVLELEENNNSSYFYEGDFRKNCTPTNKNYNPMSPMKSPKSPNKVIINHLKVNEMKKMSKQLNLSNDIDEEKINHSNNYKLSKELKNDSESSKTTNDSVNYSKSKNSSNSKQALSYFNIDDFSIIKQIGEGSYGKIYLVEEKKTKFKYAMKKIIAHSNKEIEQFSHEYEIMSALNNENILRIYGICSHSLDQTTFALYVLMELADSDWEKEINKRGQLKTYYKEEELILITRNVIKILAKMQRNGVSHRDIKPQNILIFYGKNGCEYKLADFGEAKEVFSYNQQVNTLRGTELYMAPILFTHLRTKKEDVAHNTYKSDVYSLGLCLLFASTLTFNSLYDIRESRDMNGVGITLLKYLKQRYSAKFIQLVSKMLEFSEKNRCDFIEMEEYISSMK
jgi:hypothetical protein